MIHVNPSRAQNRRACNRCHQAKLKCVLEGGRKCQRCKRTNTECTFSPPTRTQRQQNQNRSSLSSPSNQTDFLLNNWQDVDVDWGVQLTPSFLATFGLDTDMRLDNDISTSIPSPPSFEHENQSDHRNSATRRGGHDELLASRPLSDMSSISTAFPFFIHETATHAGFDGSSIHRLPTSSGHPNDGNISATITMLPSPDNEKEEPAEQLTNVAFWADKVMPLNVQFTQHLQTIPRVKPENLHNETEDAILPPSGSHNSDQTFELSESFINLLSGMCSKLPSLQASPTPNEDRPSTYLCLDEASYLLVFSTYLRFLEIHDTVFRYLLACLSHKRDRNAAKSCFYLQKLDIGSFSLATTSETRPLLFVNLMESMLARAKNLFYRLASVKGAQGNRSSQECFGGLPPIIEPNSALHAIQTRESAILNLIERIKSALSRLDYNKT